MTLTKSNAISAPGQPQEFDKSKVTADSFSVSWKEPKEKKGPLSGYQVNISVSGKSNSTWMDFSSKVTSTSFDNLQAGTKYDVKLIAFNINSKQEVLKGEVATLSLTTGSNTIKYLTGTSTS